MWRTHEHTDRRTEPRTIVPFGFSGRGLISLSHLVICEFRLFVLIRTGFLCDNLSYDQIHFNNIYKCPQRHEFDLYMYAKHVLHAYGQYYKEWKTETPKTLSNSVFIRLDREFINKIINNQFEVWQSYGGDQITLRFMHFF